METIESINHSMCISTWSAATKEEEEEEEEEEIEAVREVLYDPNSWYAITSLTIWTKAYKTNQKRDSIRGRTEGKKCKKSEEYKNGGCEAK